MPKPLRVSLTLSGGASLGAYQAGATAALLVALEHVRDEHGVDVHVDAIGGASAGAIVGMMAAYSLLEGVSGCDVLHEAWVERVSIDTLLRRNSRGPLSLEGVRAELPEMLREGRRASRQEHPLMLHVSLTGLRGLTYDLHGLRSDEPVPAVTYADWKDFELRPGGGPGQFFEPRLASPLDAVLASASHPGAFAPRVLDRREDRDEYERQGITNLPRSGWLWYSDGGLVQSEPLGRTVAAARRVEGTEDAHRLTMLIDPRGEEPTDAEEWSDRDYDATWAGGMSRALEVLPEQSLYEDLRKLQRDNRRVEWMGDLLDALDGRVDEQAAGALREVLGRIASERAELRGDDEIEVDRGRLRKRPVAAGDRRDQRARGQGAGGGRPDLAAPARGGGARRRPACGRPARRLRRLPRRRPAPQRLRPRLRVRARLGARGARGLRSRRRRGEGSVRGGRELDARGLARGAPRRGAGARPAVAGAAPPRPLHAPGRAGADALTLGFPPA